MGNILIEPIQSWNVILNLEDFTNKMKKYNIPFNVRFMGDSGWDCGPTDMGALFYSKKLNVLIFTQKTTIPDKGPSFAFSNHVVYGNGYYHNHSDEWLELI